MSRTAIATLVLLLQFQHTRAAYDISRPTQGDSDLTSFITRPEFKVPKFNVTTYHPDKLQPGYWFVGTYTKLEQHQHPVGYYEACQTGPAIYDQNGDLIWAGACYFKNQIAFDFQTWRENGTDFLSAILFGDVGLDDPKGHAVILDNTFNVVDEVFVPNIQTAFNMHEFKMLGNRRACYVAIRTVNADFEALEKDYGGVSGLIADTGIQEVDLNTKRILFEWWPSDHISLDDSTVAVSRTRGPWPGGWDWIHSNSIDKNDDGDYLLSARYTDAIYKISGKNGSILWTLGGRSSSFEMEGSWNFSRQHDARFLRHTATTETITFLDNGGDEFNQTANVSSALVVTLDKEAMVARVDRRWERPDGRLSYLRGNFQLLENGNAFVGWSDNGVISEFSNDGQLLMHASFMSYRQVTYRAYKLNFTGAPMEEPRLVVQAYGTSLADCLSVFYVSWNGATEVAFWEFYSVNQDGVDRIIGKAPRRGFETVFQARGYHKHVFAQATRADGSRLGRSEVEMSTVIGEWLPARVRGENASVVRSTVNEPPSEASPGLLFDLGAKTEL